MTTVVVQATVRRRVTVRFAALLTATVLLVGLALSPSGTSAGAADPPAVTAIRAANHGATDRVVFEFSGPLPSTADVSMRSDLFSDPSGRLVPVAGTARLKLRLAMVDWFGPPVGGPVVAANVTEVRLVSSFEGIVEYGIGLRAAAPYEVSFLTNPSRVVVHIGAAVAPADDPSVGVFAAVDNSGVMRWYRHEGTATGAYRWTLANFGNQIGEGFGAPERIISGGQGVLYRLDAAGNLRWYRHQDPAAGAAVWTVPNFGAVVATGWTDVQAVVTMDNGVFYVVRHDGTLLWYRHTGRETGLPTWIGPIEVGNGFDQCAELFRGDLGVLYCARFGGDLQYWRHLDTLEGAPIGPNSWIGGNIVGSGWGAFQHVWGTRGGVVYAIDNSGQLRWYRHLGTQTGAYDWAVTSFGAVIGTGWGNVYAVVSEA